MKIEDRIYIKEWLSLKPYEIHTTVDTYYLKLCNNVKKAMMSPVSLIALLQYVDMREIHILCCFLTSYFEDLISETNIWDAFVRKHTKMYGNQLPFYDLEDYYEEEINHQDACFLIWYFLNTVNEDKIISPFNEFITLLAEEVMQVFEEAWDYAPENSQLKTYYQLDEDEENFYVARNLVEKILFETYLFYPDTYFRLLDTEIEIIEDAKYNNTYNEAALIKENRDTTTHTIHTCLLSLKGSEWASEILGNDHPISEHYKEITTKVVGLFLYKGQDEHYVRLEHIASGRHFNLLKYSFDELAKLIEIDTIVYIGLVRWRNDWWFSGIYFQEEYNDDLIQSEKKSLDQMAMVNFLDQNREECVAPIIENQHRVFKEMNNDSIIAFMPANEIDSFIKRFYNQYNLAILADQEKKEQIKN
ncbi:MAG: DUF3843 family protein [Bacteroidota bacterium]